MSTLTDALKAVREALLLAEELKRTAEGLREVGYELREHDRRITRLEAQWDTAMQFAAPRQNQRRLAEK